MINKNIKLPIQPTKKEWLSNMLSHIDRDRDSKELKTIAERQQEVRTKADSGLYKCPECGIRWSHSANDVPATSYYTEHCFQSYMEAKCPDCLGFYVRIDINRKKLE